MCKAFRVAILVALIVPLTSRAKDLDVPELGVKLAGLPATTAEAIVVKRPNGYQAIVAISGTTTLVINRLDEPVSPGPISDEGYRKAIFKPLPDDNPAGARGEPISVSGHDAWLAAYLLPSFTMCRYYVVVDAHPYEFTVSATAASRPPEFDAAITAIPAGTTFEPIRQSTVEPPGWPGLPYARPSHDVHWYPNRSRRLGEEGPVDVQFRVNAAGRAQQIKTSASGDLSVAAANWVAADSFDVPGDWERRGGPNATLTLEFQFHLVRPGSVCPGPAAPRIPGAGVVTICDAAVPRAN